MAGSAASIPTSQPRYLFVEWRDKDSTIILGHFAGNKRSRYTDYSGKLQTVSQTTIEQWLQGAQGRGLLFFHCMWGQEPHFHKQCLKALGNIAEKDSVEETIISFLWHAGGILYAKDWEAAVDKGAALGLITHWINQHFQNKTNVICHSMGNRFFEGVLRTLPQQGKIFENVVLFSADLDNTTQDPDFQRCLQATQHVSIYIHHHDRVLMASEMAHGKKRLGRSGPDSASKDFQIIDMTQQLHGLQNHTHLDKKWVQQSIAERFYRLNP